MSASIIQRLPHGPEIVAIDRIISRTENSIRCSAHWDGSAFRTVEYIAQAAAVGRIAGGSGQSARSGAIVRVRLFELLDMQAAESAASRTRLILECAFQHTIGQLYEVSGEAILEGGPVLSRVTMTIIEIE